MRLSSLSRADTILSSGASVLNDRLQTGWPEGAVHHRHHESHCPSVSHTHVEGGRSDHPGLWLGGDEGLPGGNNRVLWLFQVLYAPLGAPAQRAARNPSSAPRGSIRMNLDRFSARHAKLESEELFWC